MSRSVAQGEKLGRDMELSFDTQRTAFIHDRPSLDAREAGIETACIIQ
jgi:hypothetical protein